MKVLRRGKKYDPLRDKSGKAVIVTKEEAKRIAKQKPRFKKLKTGRYSVVFPAITPKSPRIT